MTTSGEMRTIALSLPEVEEKSHFLKADFRVRNKIFACLSRDGMIGTLKLPPELQSIQMDLHPEIFSAATGAWGRSGWTNVELAVIDLGELGALLAEAWRLTAPKGLVAAYDREHGRRPLKR